jgi:hypothetical protein
VADLREGDTLFIPRSWWHHVRTVERSIAVNHWWSHGVRALVALTADVFKRVRGISR